MQPGRNCGPFPISGRDKHLGRGEARQGILQARFRLDWPALAAEACELRAQESRSERLLS